ncbi:MAG: O-methyltransferase [Spirochaetaceae bacterium]|nr:O-methyltransferase [Spirochaetaceae bacterium]
MEEISEIKEYAKEHSVPIMMDEGIEFICNYIVEHNVETVLELGTAIGYSAMRFARLRDDIFVSTIEIDIERYQQAVRNIHDNNLMDRITVYLGNALSYTFKEKFDLIFIDAAKSQYINYFEKFKNNLTENGAIISDNLFFHGIVENIGLTHNYSTIKLIRKLRRYIDFLKSNQEFETTFYTLGDGISVSKRRHPNLQINNNKGESYAE